ncbi:DUF4168 domain-containing protein [Alteriqipengyuania lutimaris]|uniref:DUF4168 domain-containing protein n=1 Tax=Alteriqipengyuania lutimaris TaxID=1538146 RepID=A0A395LGN6_9SPHN|nr:DUF4168 domain-containing protein [Alteriqipengyuania lutimaris]MBB3035477.1 hypothetical protein [Alteriqipengyuania lutimaris]RDS76046.1 DUF4168 domain-containing protein [Alteriqipengyuania lutimaris]
MNLFLSTIATASLALAAQPSLAQQAPAAPSATQMAPVSDAELETFVIAASMIGQIQQNAEMEKAAKDEAAMKVLSQAQMTPQRFNTIGAALQTNEKLQARATQTVSRLKAQQADG